MKFKVVPHKPKPSPQMVSYWEAFNAGRDHERKVVVAYFVNKLEELHKIPGIGDKTYQKITNFIDKEWG